MSIINVLYIESMLRALPGASVITTAKGSLLTHDGITSVEQLVGANGFILFADNTQTTGLIWRQGTPADVQLGNVQNQLNNFTAVTDPTVNDDANDGYSVGSRWINNATQTVFTAVSVAVGAAVWVVSGGTSPNVSAGDGLFYTPLTTILNVGGSTTIFAAPDQVYVNSSAVSGQFLKSGPGGVGTEAVWGVVDLADTTNVTGTLTVPQGGTGSTSLAPNRVLQADGAGTAIVSSLYTFPAVDGTAGQVLATDGAGQFVFANSPILTRVTLTTTDATITTITNVAIPIGKTVKIEAKFSAYSVLPSNRGASFELDTSYSNFAGTAVSNVLAASVTSYKDPFTTPWTVGVGAPVLGNVPITVTGQAATTIDWVVEIQLVVT